MGNDHQKRELNRYGLEKILSMYDLGEVIKSKILEEGAVQSNIFVETERDQFVVKIYERNRSYESVLFEVNLLKYLKEKNYPCPNPIKNNAGGFVSSYKNKPVVIFEFIKGKHIKAPTKSQERQVIQKVAELQILTRDYMPAYKNARWNYGVEFCGMFARREAKRINTVNSLKKLEWYLKEISELTLPQSFPKGICHSDFNYSNILFKDGAFNAILDFDDANYTFLTFDLASLFEPKTFLFNHKSWIEIEPADSLLKFSEARFFLNEYEKYRKLSPIEKKYMFDILKLVILIDCLWYFERGNVENFLERKKLDCLDLLGRERFYKEIFK
ncbi:MAG: Homoserine kinase [Promethearchaeota archaeon]|nr:MAG: Homoserine kinase [Candidatus Lokiarchaeota archaeon]